MKPKNSSSRPVTVRRLMLGEEKKSQRSQHGDGKMIKNNLIRSVLKFHTFPFVLP